MAPTLLTWMTSFLLTVTSLCMLTCHGFRLSHGPAPRHQRSAGTQPGHPNKHKRDTVGQDPQVAPKDSSLRYGVLMDAGSSSTKVKVYSYTPAGPLVAVPHMRLEISERVRPGLGSFVSSSRAELRDYLVEVLSHATAVVPQRLHASTPVYVMATAGMRVLPALEAKSLLREVGSVLQNSSLNPFIFHPQHVSILSGEEEAVYAWLAVNYLRGYFSSHSSQADPAGVLEMGGGSMQVAFLPDTPLYQEEFQVYVGRRRFDLYAQTYLSYGSKYLTDQVRRRLLLQQQEREGGVRDMQLYSPCMLSDDTDSFEWEGAKYRVQGTGNVSQCEEVMAGILEPPDTAQCSPGPCAIGNTYQPSVGNHSFYAISAFVYAPQTLDAVEAGGVLNITKLRHHARNYCQLTVSQAVAETGTKARFASNDCLMGLYIPLLLTSALGFDPHTRAIIVANEINGTGIDWALGAMVQLLSMTFMDDLDSLMTCHDSQNKSDSLSVKKVISPSSGTHCVTSILTQVSLVTVLWACTHLLWQ